MVKFWSNSLKNTYFCLAICSWYFPNIQIISRGCNILIANHVTRRGDFSTGPRDFLSALGTKLGLKGHKESLEGAEALIWAPKHVKLTDLLFGLIKNIWNNQSKLDLKWFLHEFVLYELPLYSFIEKVFNLHYFREFYMFLRSIDTQDGQV